MRFAGFAFCPRFVYNSIRKLFTFFRFRTQIQNRPVKEEVHLQALEYPFDGEALLRKKRALRRELAAQPGLVEKKVAIVSGTTVGEVKNMLELFLMNSGIRPTFWEGPYGLYYESIAFDDGSLAAFAPDVIYIHTSVHNLQNLPVPADSAAAAEEKFAAEAARWQGLWQAAARFGCPVVQNNFELPDVRVLGNFDAVAAAYGAADQIGFEGLHRRSDIGQKALAAL